MCFWPFKKRWAPWQQMETKLIQETREYPGTCGYPGGKVTYIFYRVHERRYHLTNGSVQYRIREYS